MQDQSGRVVSKGYRVQQGSRDRVVLWGLEEIVDLSGRKANKAHKAFLGLLAPLVLAENQVVTVEMDNKGFKAAMLWSRKS